MKASFLFKNSFTLCMAAILLFPIAGIAEAGIRVSEKYPDLARGSFCGAILKALPDGVLVQVNEVDITQEMLDQNIAALTDAQREDAAGRYFYVLETMINESIILADVFSDEYRSGDSNETPDVLQRYFDDFLGDVAMTEEEARSYYDNNTEMFDGSPFDEVKDMIMAKLLEEKKRQAWQTHISEIGYKIKIYINEAWVAEQAERVKDNPVDRARQSGKVTLAVFSTDWCPICKKLKPVIDAVTSLADLGTTIVVLNADKEVFLNERFAVTAIPVLIFFDKGGKEVERHIGFITEEKLVAKLKALNS